MQASTSRLEDKVNQLTTGRGVRLFVNSVTLLAFRKFLDEKGKHQLPVYVIDSPLKKLGRREPRKRKHQRYVFQIFTRCFKKWAIDNYREYE